MHSFKVSPLGYLLITKGTTVTLQWRNLAETTLPKGSMWASPVTAVLTSCVSDITSRGEHDLCGILPHNVQPQSRQDKTSEPKLKRILQNKWPTYYKILLKKDKEKPRNCNKLEKPKEMAQKNVRWNPGLNCGIEKGQ